MDTFDCGNLTVAYCTILVNELTFFQSAIIKSRLFVSTDEN